MNSNEGDVVITGVGPVTSIGIGGDALWASLTQGRCEVQPRVLPADLGRTVDLPIAAMPETGAVAGLDAHLEYLAGQECAGYRDVGYALLAVELALADAGIEYDRDRNRIGVIQVFEAPGVERTVGRLFDLFTHLPGPPAGAIAPNPQTPPAASREPLSAGERARADAQAGPSPPPVYDMLSPFFYHMQPFLYVHLVGKAFGFRGFSTSVHNACSSGAFAIELAAQQIRAGQADVMVVVGGEAFETGVRLEWFRRLNLYCLDGRMRPFDAQPSGFLVGEGAAAIVLESASHVARRGASVYARYCGGAFAQQGWKQVIPDVRSARLSDVLIAALARAESAVDEIDLVVPHGAGTQLSDRYEASCLAKALMGQRDHAIATAFKPSFGHMLAASGAIDTVATLLAMKHQAVPPTLNTAPDRVQLPVPLATNLVKRPLKTVLKLSTGFTGHDAALVFRAP